MCVYIYMYTYRKFGLNKPFLLCVGKRYGYKNYDILWQGLALMPKSFRGMNFKIYMKGKGLKKQKSENMKIKCLKDKKKRTKENWPVPHAQKPSRVKKMKMKGKGLMPLADMYVCVPQKKEK